jgi:hypothetical protein
MIHDIETIRNQIATLTAALDALENKQKEPTLPTQVRFYAEVEFAVPVPDLDDSSFNANGFIFVDLDLLNWSKNENGVIRVHSWDDDDLIKIVRDKISWLPGYAKVFDWSFGLDDDDVLGP